MKIDSIASNLYLIQGNSVSKSILIKVKSLYRNYSSLFFIILIPLLASILPILVPSKVRFYLSFKLDKPTKN